MLSKKCSALLSCVLVSQLSAAVEDRASDSIRQSTSLDRPIYLGIEAHALEDGPATGAKLVAPLTRGENAFLLAEAYGFKGDAQLGGLGAGLILRYQLSARETLEVNGFFDALQDREGFSYPQLGFGVSYSRAWMTLRVNGYLPLRDGDDHVTGKRSWTETDGQLGGQMTSVDWSQDFAEYRAPGRGFDAEMDLRLPTPPKWVDPRLTVGYFYRAADDRSKVYSGVLVRGELHFGDHWSAEAEYRNDAGEIGQEYRFVVRYQRWFGREDSVRPSQGMASSGFDRQMVLPAIRRPWPTVTRAESDRDPRRGATRVTHAHAPATPEEAAGDCCPSASSPLIFD